MKKEISFLLCFLILLSGCATIQRKFRREKKKKKKEVILSLEDYSQNINYHDLYRKHYLLWQYWHQEIIDSLGFSRKRQIHSYERAYENLTALGKYIKGEKRDLLDKYCLSLEKIGELLEKKISLNRIEIERIKRDLEKLKRLIDKDFRYSQIKDFIISPPSQDKSHAD